MYSLDKNTPPAVTMRSDFIQLQLIDVTRSLNRFYKLKILRKLALDYSFSSNGIIY